MVISILLAISLTSLNGASFLLIYKLASNKGWAAFSRLIFGSMAVRYFTTASLVWLIVTKINVNVLVFTLIFFISTFIFIIVEILFIHNQAKMITLKNKDLTK